MRCLGFRVSDEGFGCRFLGWGLRVLGWRGFRV